MPSFETRGVLIAKTDTQKKTDTFSVRLFALEVPSDNPQYVDYIQLQLSNDNCAKLDGANIGDIIDVKVNVRGRKYAKDGVDKFFNSLDCWFVRIEKQQTANSCMPPQFNPNEAQITNTGLPF